MTGLDEAWPLFALRIVTPRLELRPPTDHDLAGLLGAIAAGVHDPDTMPFAIPWTDVPSPERERRALQFWWSSRASWSVDEWLLPLAVVVDGIPVGVQDVRGSGFREHGRLETGSWLSLPWQGKGIGTEMRRAVAHFAFTTLGASALESGAFPDNVASNRVSEVVGYVRDGEKVIDRRGVPSVSQKWLLTRERWEATQTTLPVEVHGFDACRAMFGR